MDNKDLIEKIQKLLSLAQSDNKNEAELASKKAQELLIKHNLKMSEIQDHNPEYSQNEIDFGRKKPQELKYINDLLRSHFFVYIYRSGSKDIVTGSEENLEIALYVRSFLINAFKNLYKAEKRAKNWSGQENKASFYYGLWLGLNEQLNEQKKKFDADNKLMVINKAIESYVKDKNPNIRNTTARVNASNRDAVNSGINQGKNLKINKGLNQQNTGKVLYLNRGVK